MNIQFCRKLAIFKLRNSSDFIVFNQVGYDLFMLCCKGHLPESVLCTCLLGWDIFPFRVFSGTRLIVPFTFCVPVDLI